MQYIGSYHQEPIWFIDAFERGSLYDHGPVYHNIPLILQVRSGLSPETVMKTLAFLVQENEILRTEIVTVDNAVFQDVKECGVIPLQIIDRSAEQLTEDEIVALLLEVNNSAFRVGISGTLCKAAMLNVNSGESYLLV